MANVDDENRPLILLTGGSGYVGGRLIPLLEKQGVRLRCLARSPAINSQQKASQLHGGRT